MEIGQTQTIAAPAAPAPASSSTISADFDTFLQMLTAQLQYQDPLNPIEASDYAVQLATFSSVEQSVLTNDLLKSMSAQLNSSGLADLAQWVGKEVRAPAPAYFDGTPITLAPTPPLYADSAEIVVRNSFGTEVVRFATPVSTDQITWDGRGYDGAQLPAGVYSFEVTSMAGGEVIQTSPVDTYNSVAEVQSINGALTVILRGGIEIDSQSVTALRAAAG